LLRRTQAPTKKKAKKQHHAKNSPTVQRLINTNDLRGTKVSLENEDTQPQPKTTQSSVNTAQDAFSYEDFVNMLGGTSNLDADDLPPLPAPSLVVKDEPPVSFDEEDSSRKSSPSPNENGVWGQRPRIDPNPNKITSEDICLTAFGREDLTGYINAVRDCLKMQHYLAKKWTGAKPRVPQAYKYVIFS
jgi:hypothetical protein